MKFTNIKLPKAAAAAVGALAVAGAVAGGALLYDAMGTEPAAAQETGADAVFMDRPTDLYVPAGDLAPYDPASDPAVANDGVIVNMGESTSGDIYDDSRPVYIGNHPMEPIPQ